MRRILLALAFVLTPLLASAQGTAENQQATFRSGVDLVTVSATVRDGKGRLVKDLTKKDFEVIDRGERRAINEFRSERAPLSLAILFDVSGSMDTADRSTAAKFAAHHLLNRSWRRAATKPGCLLLTAGYARWPRFRSIRAPSRARWGRSIRSGPPRYMTRLPQRRNASPRGRWRGARWSCSPTASIPRAA